jgi:hypothetical protein
MNPIPHSLIAAAPAPVRIDKIIGRDTDDRTNAATAAAMNTESARTTRQ